MKQADTYPKRQEIAVLGALRTLVEATKPAMQFSGQFLIRPILCARAQNVTKRDAPGFVVAKVQVHCASLFNRLAFQV